MNLKYILIFATLLLSSCIGISEPVDKTDSWSDITQMGTISTGKVEYQDPLVEDISGSGGAYYPIFDGLESRVIPVEHTSWVTTTIAFINSEATSMRVAIGFPLSVSGANLRLSQIVMPDGTMDGPFGIDTTIDLTQKGGYELRFQENQMSGDSWSGSALITISLMDNE